MQVRRVIIAEDNPELRELLARFLRNNGYVVHAVTNGDELLDALGALGPFDILITDDDMRPGMSGSEALARIKGDPDSDHMLRILVSGTASESDAHNVGAVFFPKPYRTRQVIALLKPAQPPP